MKIRNILIATDFSESAAVAQSAAFEIAKRFDAKVHAFHALEVPLPIFEPYSVSVPDAFIAETRKMAKEKLQEVVQAAESLGVECSPALGAIPAPTDIADHARTVNAELVVVGTEGHTGIRHFFLGSVAEGTIKGAPCSVLVARGPLDATLETVVVGTDFSSEAQSALDTACEIANQFHADLHLVHAADTAPALTGQYEISMPTPYYESVMAAARKRIAALAETCRVNGTVSTEVSTVPAAVALPEAAERLGAGLIVVGSQGRTGAKHLLLGSVAERTVRHAPCSVWTVRAPRS